MPLLERPRSNADLDDAAATALLLFVFRLPWQDYWVARALDWVEAGLWREDMAEPLRAISQDRRYSQRTRHRAWSCVKART